MVLSPMRLVNQVLAVLVQSAPNIGMIAGMFAGVPETYSLAIYWFRTKKECVGDEIFCLLDGVVEGTLHYGYRYGSDGQWQVGVLELDQIRIN